MPSRLDPLILVALTIGVLSVSTSGALIAYAAAPALAIAFWRNALAVGVLTPVAVATRRHEWKILRHDRTWLWCVLSGVLLALHFGTWVPSVKLTTVATSTALAATQPIWAALIMLWQGKRFGRGMWIGMIAAVVGVAIATGADFAHGGSQAVFGDVLAIFAGMTAAAYTIVGERVRAKLSTTTYTTVCYGVCAIALLTVCLTFGVQMTGFDGNTWLAILGLTVGAQLLGHSMFNYTLNKVSAVVISLLILLEVPVAALLGWAWLGQTPPAAAWPGLIILLIGLAICVGQGRSNPDYQA